jgi:FkbM family methyltransferase
MLQTKDVWNRFKLHQADGNLIGLLPALSDLYNRSVRIEAKLDRILGNEQIRLIDHQRPAERRFIIPLPEPPSGTGAAKVSELDLTVHWSMYVPRVLAKTGFGGYEPASLPHFLAALAEAGDGEVLDIGANIGPYALLARAFSDRRVRGFEPTPELAEVAESCAAANGLDYLVERIALGAEEGTAKLHLSDSTDSSNSLSPTFRPFTYVLEVPLESLDNYVNRTRARPAIIKVDTETTEPDVLRGSVRTVAEYRPWIFCEVLHGRTEADLAEAMAGWGYTAYYLDGPGPLMPRSEIVGDPEMKNFMWLFTPAPLPQEHWGKAAAWRQALESCPAGHELKD